jgi:hypothetical protein
MTIDEILRSGAKIKTKFGITTKEVASILKHRHDMGKIREILSPIAGAATMEAVRRIHAQVLEKRPRTLPFVRVGLDYLDRVSTPLERSDPKSNPVAMEQHAAPAIARMGEDGKLYPRRIHIYSGVRSKMLSHAMDEFGTNTDRKIHTTGYQDALDCQYSQAGINRKGIYAPIQEMLGGIFYDADLSNDARGTVTKAMRRTFCYTHAMTDDVESYMDGSNAGNLDLYFPLVSTYSTHRIRNRMIYTPIDISLYLLRCREETDECPQAEIWSSWDTTGPASSSYNAPVEGNPQPYVWPTQEGIVSQDDPEGTQIDQTFVIESSCQLGVTPQWSPQFNKLWQVCDVIKQRLSPNDILEFHFSEEFAQCHSLNDFIANYGPNFTSNARYNRYTAGDYEILITFNGIPGTCEGNIESTTLSVDALKSRISKTVSHEIKYAWPTLTTGDSTQTVEPDELFRRGWITAAEKTTVLGRRTDYFANGYNAVITTNATEEAGGGV